MEQLPPARRVEGDVAAGIAAALVDGPQDELRPDALAAGVEGEVANHLAERAGRTVAACIALAGEQLGRASVQVPLQAVALVVGEQVHVAVQPA